MTQIQIDWSRTQETRRHNVASEVQAAKELAEANRHNIVSEVETNRHNIAGEKETHRHNFRTENIEDEKLEETKRHNVRTESLEGKKIDETIRHNKKAESIDTSRVKETIRHDKVTEKQQATHLSNETKQTSANVAKARADADLTRAKTALQEFTNSIDMSDPSLFKANRFINVFKKGSEAAWFYYGLELATKKQKEALNKAAKSGTAANKAVEIIDSLNYQKNGQHLSATEKNNWLRIFSLGKQGSKVHNGKGGKGGKF